MDNIITNFKSMQPYIDPEDRQLYIIHQMDSKVVQLRGRQDMWAQIDIFETGIDLSIHILN